MVEAVAEGVVIPLINRVCSDCKKSKDQGIASILKIKIKCTMSVGSKQFLESLGLD